MLTLLRLDERAKAYFTITVINVLVTIPFTVYLVVVEDMGANGILLGTFGTGAIFLAYRLWVERRRLSLRPDLGLLRRMVRFGLPTMPAELTLYSLNFIDRIIIVRLAGLAEAGLYALAVKFANGLQVLARGFQLAFPPLAYSIRDDDEARRVYALLVTWFAAVLAFAVTGLWLEARWIVRLLAADEFFPAYEAVGPLAAGIAMYALYLAMVVVLGRTGRTEYGLPATVAAVVVNVALNLILVPSEGIVGAAIALVVSYVVVLVLMYLLTQRLFTVPYEWRRLALLVVVSAALIGVAEAFVPTDGADGFLLRLLLWLAFPLILYVLRFLTPEERVSVRTLLDPAAVKARLADLGSGPQPHDDVPPERACRARGLRAGQPGHGSTVGSPSHRKAEMEVDQDAPAVARGRIEIVAAPQAVWDLLTRIEGWPEWQPKVKSASLEGEVASGSVFRWKPGPMTITSTIRHVEAPREIGWTGETVGISAVHVWRLGPSAVGTEVATEESWDGWAVRAFKGPMRKSLQREIDAALENLKAAAERDGP